MTTICEKIIPKKIPAPDPCAREVTALWLNRVDGKHLTEPLPAPAHELLQSRYNQLDMAFKERGDLERPIAAMLDPFPRRPAQPSAYAYVITLSVPAPFFAALEAIERVCRGEIPNPQFAPLPGQLRAIAWHVALPFWAELQHIQRILQAKPPRPTESREKRAAVAARILADWHNRVTLQDLSPVSSYVGIEKRPSSSSFYANGVQAHRIAEF